jgi:hypothetical protein
MPSGLFDLNGKTDTIIGRTGGGNNHDALGLDISATGSGDVDLNGGTLRIGNTVAENGRVQVRVLSGGMPVPSRIDDGTFELMGATGGLVRRILVDDSAAVEDLIVTAIIADGGAVASNFIKNNNGRMVLAPPTLGGGNTFTAPTIVEGGELILRHQNALGTTAGNTTVNNGTTLFLDGVGVTGETLRLLGPDNTTTVGNGFGGQGALVNMSGNNTWDGPVNLRNQGNAANASNLSITAASGTTLTINGVIAADAGQTGAVGLYK